jgi:phosphatidylinositol alpha-1,6-mannosyltransferase
VTHVFVTNDFPPKVGGIQSYLFELWRRLDPASFVVLTASSHPEAAAFDAAQRDRGVRIERMAAPVLLPGPGVVRRARALAEETGAGLVVLDPALPLGLIGTSLGLPYAVVVHGAEVSVPGRLPLGRTALRRVLDPARLIIAAGDYPAAEVRRVTRSRVPVLDIPPGVDVDRFVPRLAPERRRARAALGLATRGPLVVSVSRLVPRKGMDVLVEASAALTPSFPDLHVVIAGGGRDRGRLERAVARLHAPVTLLGRMDDEQLPDLYAAGDLFVMACRNRWLGLEQEGFGIVFLEAAAAGVAQIAGRSGGAQDAVADGTTGIVLDRPGDPGVLALAMRRLLDDATRRRRMGRAARRRVETSFGYDLLAHRLAAALKDVSG